jgi:hypothetical protein
MKRNLLVAALLTATVGAFGQGTITFNNRATAGTPSPVVSPVFGLDPACPTCEKQGNPVSTWNGSDGPTPAPTGTQTYGGAPLAGTGYTAALWGVNVNSPDSALTDPAAQPISVTPFRFSSSVQNIKGFWTGTSPGVPGVPGGSAERAKFIVRAWDNRGGTITSWSQVLADPTIPHGESLIFTVNQQLGLSPSIPSPNLSGFQSFQLFVVPEPSVIALGVLGAGCLFLLRRRK